MPHHRLFVALPLPSATRRHLLGLMGGVAGARWQGDAQLHCTIRFLGELDGHAAEDVGQALSGLRSPAIDAALEGLGTFDRQDRIDTLWIGITPFSELRTLHGRVDRRLALAGVAPDPRAYRPHVTIARFARTAPPPPDLAARLPTPPRVALRFAEVRLYESVLTRDGARYETIARYPLG
jgi:2'-5' RNA ligase